MIAALAGDPNMARAVGNALHKNPDPANIPCYRVVNAKGELSGSFAFGGEAAQEELLQADGIEVVNGRLIWKNINGNSNRTQKGCDKIYHTLFTVLFFIQLQYRHKCLLRHLYAANLAHTLFPFLLLFEQLFLTGNITAIACFQP